MPLPQPDSEDLADWAREFSRLAHGRPRQEVEIEIDNPYHAYRGLGREPEEDQDDETDEDDA